MYVNLVAQHTPQLKLLHVLMQSIALIHLIMIYFFCIVFRLYRVWLISIFLTSHNFLFDNFVPFCKVFFLKNI